jgi:arylsulfatase A-like enzyme
MQYVSISGELWNLYDDSSFASVLHDHERRLTDWEMHLDRAPSALDVFKPIRSWDAGGDNRKGELMKRRNFISTAACTTALGSNLFAATGKRPPNVIVIQPDQHKGTVMSCAGDRQISTPNLDRLSAEGIRFSNCASASPVCSPFRGTMQTGLYCYQHGVTSNGIRLDYKLTTFAKLFKRAGYATGYVGKWHLNGFLPPKNSLGYVPPEGRMGWDEWLGHEKGHWYFDVAYAGPGNEMIPVKGYDWEPVWHTDMALDFATRHHADGKPFLYYIAYGPPHKPEDCPEKYLNMFPQESFTLPPDVEHDLNAEQKQEVRKALQVYYGQVTAIDDEIGRLLDGLKKIGADENTIVLYTSDHGDRLGSHMKKAGNQVRGKGEAYQTAFRIPFIIRWPGGIQGGTETDALVSSIDLAPTLLDLAGFPVPGDMPGHSMRGWCSGGEGYRNRMLYLGLGTNKGKKQGDKWWRAAWDGRHVYCAKGAEGDPGWLYDHQKDPYEMQDFIEDPAYEEVRKKLGAEMLRIAEETGDPVLPDLKEMLGG